MLCAALPPRRVRPYRRVRSDTAVRAEDDPPSPREAGPPFRREAGPLRQYRQCPPEAEPPCRLRRYRVAVRRGRPCGSAGAMWAALGRLGVAQAVGLARLIAVRPAAAGAFSIPHVTMATHFSKDQEERIRCVKGDLFSCPATDALAHCISEDCRMGAGIAVLFKKKFGGVQELLDQKKKTGEVAVLQRDERYIYYLITKQKVSHKPTYENMQKSLEAMKAHCLNNGVTDISMPRIGCGLDGLQWEKVSAILEEVFDNTDIKITVYSL